MAEYVPPNCEEDGCRAYASVHLHIDAIALPPGDGDVMLLCASHSRRWMALLKQRRVEYVRFEIG